jgi:hypothetical protein
MWVIGDDLIARKIVRSSDNKLTRTFAKSLSYSRWFAIAALPLF